MAKGDVLLKALETLGEITVSGLDFFSAFINAGYGASSGKIDYEMSKIEIKRAERKKEAELKQKYYNLIYKLKEDGLIKTEVKNKKALFVLTGKGKQKLEKLKLNKEKRLPPSANYRKENGKFTIITFDIPERERFKRRWIREVLRNLDLRMIQKSVWIGKTKIPKQFVDDLEKFKMIEFVEIFEISKAGSLRQIS